MDFGLAAWPLLVLAAVSAICLGRRNNTGDHHEQGRVSPSWPAQTTYSSMTRGSTVRS